MARFVQNVASRAAADVVTRLLAFISLPVISKALGPESYGAWAVVQTLPALLVPVALVGLNMSIVRLAAADPRPGTHLGSGYTVVLAASTVFSVLLYLAAPLLNMWFLGSPDGVLMIRWTAPVIVFNAVDEYARSFLRAREAIPLLSLLEVLNAILVVAAIVLVLSRGGALLELIRAVTLLRGMMAALGMAVTYRGIRPVRPDLAAIRFMLRVGGAIVATQLASVLILSGDRLAVGYFMEPGDVGRYAIVYSLSSIVILLANPLNYGLYPRICSHWARRESTELLASVRQASRFYALTCLPAAVGLVILTRPILSVMTTPEFMVSPWITLVLVAAHCVQTLSSPVQYLTYAQDRVHLQSGLWIGGAFANVILNVLLVPHWGIIGAALATLLTYSLVNLVLWVVAGLPLRAAVALPTLGRAAVAAAVMAGGVFWLMPDSLVSLLLAAAAGGFLFYSAMAILGEFSRDELRGLLRL